MKIKFLPIWLFALVLGACSQHDELAVLDEKQQLEPLNPMEINRQIKAIISQTGTFDWSDADDLLLWSAVVYGDSLVSVGYGTEPFSINKTKDELSAKQFAIELVTENARNNNMLKAGTKIVQYEDAVLNFIDLKTADYETVSNLRKAPNVRYVEPTGYRFFDYEVKLKSDSGCDTAGDAINSADYRLISPNCYVSWVYDKHNVPAAWNYSTGAGITVGVIDTGVSPNQSLLGSSFNDGYSTGRTIAKYGTFVDSIWPWSTTTDGPNDKCSHGTAMVANVASPRNDNYMPVGVAYNCNIVAYRATGDVVLDGGHEQTGVANALTALANRADVKIISMSIGHIFSVGKISDAIKYAYSKGKLIFAAGGTSTSFTNFVGVIFPASMAECVAVTGITDAAGYTECAVCHKGGKIDFTVIMQRTGDSERTSPTTSFYENNKQYVGGSSIATSFTAGVAALVWAKYPTWTRTQILDRLKQSASIYPNRNSNFGWGNINAYLAVQ